MEFSLAPMEGITGFPMRLWLTWASRPERMTTPFLRVNRAQPERDLPPLFAPELFELRGILPYELTPQFLSADPDSFLRAADFLEAATPAGIELNCGCPCPTCIGKNAGSGILADPDTFRQTTHRLAAALGPGKLAIKMRLGYSSDDEFDELLGCVASLPLARLSVHGRTRTDGYRGRARWWAVEAAAKASTAPTWGSGDIVNHETLATTASHAPSVAGVMIGRGAIRNPWIFEEFRRKEAVTLDAETLANALLAFLLVNELSITAPEKLIARVGNGHFTAFCGTDGNSWKDLAAKLSSLVCGVPCVWNAKSAADGFDDWRVSPTTLARLRFLWGQLRTSLPASFGGSRILRAKTVGQFFAEYTAAAKDLGRFAIASH